LFKVGHIDSLKFITTELSSLVTLLNYIPNLRDPIFIARVWQVDYQITLYYILTGFKFVKFIVTVY